MNKQSRSEGYQEMISKINSNNRTNIYILNNCPHGESTYKRTSSAWICTLDIPTQWWEDIVCTICISAISPDQYTIESRRSIKKKSIPLTVQPMEGAVVR